MTLQSIINKWARLPNRSGRREIRAYAFAGVISHADEFDVVYGQERSRVTCPLFGHPMIARAQ